MHFDHRRRAKVGDEVERASFSDHSRAALVAAQSIDREFQLAVEVLGSRRIGERSRLLQPLVGFRLVDVVGVRREKVRNQRALANNNAFPKSRFSSV